MFIMDILQVRILSIKNSQHIIKVPNLAENHICILSPLRLASCVLCWKEPTHSKRIWWVCRCTSFVNLALKGKLVIRVPSQSGNKERDVYCRHLHDNAIADFEFTFPFSVHTLWFADIRIISKLLRCKESATSAAKWWCIERNPISPSVAADIS